MTEQARLDGKKVLVTGASAGIGRACALALAKLGAAIVATGRREAELASLVREIEGKGGKCRAVAGDLNDRAFVARLVEEAGELDILVNNAGVLTYAPALDMRPEESEAMFRTNVLAALDVALAVARGMAKRKRGHIVMMTSTAARATYRLGVVYCASKAALSSLAQGLRLELQAEGIRVSEVAPGMVDTEIRATSTHPAVQTALKARTIAPLTAEEVAQAVVYAVTAPENCCPDLIELRPRGAA
jgi:NADP-dependent 3-hydroxy acid dehydrogenase YdfG